jgi:hypothetical protein
MPTNFVQRSEDSCPPSLVEAERKLIHLLMFRRHTVLTGFC